MRRAGQIAISADSRYVVAVECPSAFRHDLATQTTETFDVACNNSPYNSVNADGRLMAFADFNQIYLKDFLSGTTTLVSLNAQGTSAANGPSSRPSISHDGRFVVFRSQARDLVEASSEVTPSIPMQIYLRDLQLGLTVLISRAYEGNRGGNRPASSPAFSADGRTIVFGSSADDLVPGDFNETGDVFLVRIHDQDSDSDGMDDAWEVAYFNDLNRNGGGDLDNDGKTDREEFQTGTDPTNANSVFAVLSLSNVLSPGGPSAPPATTLVWCSAPGKSYRLQFKDRLQDNWSEVSEIITAGGTTATYVHHVAPVGQRIYRVALVP